MDFVFMFKFGFEIYTKDWENESIPLEPKGKGPPKFIKPEDKHSCNEGNYLIPTLKSCTL